MTATEMAIPFLGRTEGHAPSASVMGSGPMRALAGRLPDDPGLTTGIIGQSVAWRAVLTRAAKVAPTETTVCLQGESGTGKEVLARFIHRASPRRSGPFVAINCAALPEQLLESELFGLRARRVHRRRAAAGGADRGRRRRGACSWTRSARWRRRPRPNCCACCRSGEFTRLGGNRPTRTNVRVIAATNRDLPSAVADGLFRADLFYRLNVFDIRIPPLRERREDIGLSPVAFLEEIGRALRRPPAELTPARRHAPDAARLAGQRARAAQRSRAGVDRLRTAA